MAETVTLPDLGEGIPEGEIVRWLVREGDRVEVGEPLLEVQTDKATVEIPTTAAGVVLAIVAGAGAVVAVGGVIAIVGAEGEPLLRAVSEVSAAPAEPSPIVTVVQEQPAEAVRATPGARELARAHGLDLRAVAGSGEGGRILEGDVRAAVSAAAVGETRVPIRGIRRAIVEQVARTHREVPAVTFVEECDFTGIDDSLVLPLTLRAAARALRDHPELNARIDGESIVLLDRVDVGIVVQADDGLVIPVVRRCAERTIAELEHEVRRLTDAARAGALTPDDVRGSTFTVTWAGDLGGILVTPLIHHPEVAILGVHRIADLAVVGDGLVVVRRVAYVSVTFDHRVVDGAGAAAFCLDVIDRLQSGA